MTALYIATNEVRAAIERLRLSYPDLAEDADGWELTLSSETDLNEVLSRIVKEEREAVAFVEAIADQIDELCSRQARFIRRKEALRGLIMQLMDSAGRTTVTLPIATLSVSKSRAGCVVTDEAELPDAYVKITRTPKKSEITAALVKGQTVSGALLRNGAPHLTIRVA